LKAHLLQGIGRERAARVFWLQRRECSANIRENYASPFASLR